MAAMPGTVHCQLASSVAGQPRHPRPGLQHRGLVRCGVLSRETPSCSRISGSRPISHGDRLLLSGRRRRNHSLQATMEEEEAITRDYELLSQKIQDMAEEVQEGLAGTSVYLVGLMGSGKTTVGKMLAKTLGYCFMDTDAVIEQATHQTIAEIFAEEGEAAFRETETQILQELSPFRNCVVATGGGVVLARQNWGYMQHAVVVWLSGPPQLLAKRVVADGTAKRPLVSNGSEGPDSYDAALQKLADLLEVRREKYRQADVEVSLEGDEGGSAPAMLVTYRVLSQINGRIKEATSEREAKKSFTIVDSSDKPETMQTVPSRSSYSPEE